MVHANGSADFPDSNSSQLPDALLGYISNNLFFYIMHTIL